MVGVVLDRREPVVVNDYQAEFAHQPEAHGHQSGTRAMAAVPLMYEGRVIGVLMVLASAAIALTFHEDSASMADGDAASSSTAVAPRENMKSRITATDRSRACCWVMRSAM